MNPPGGGRRRQEPQISGNIGQDSAVLHMLNRIATAYVLLVVELAFACWLLHASRGEKTVQQKTDRC